MKTSTKTLAASLSLAVSFSANAGMGGLNVQSVLGEPFSGSIIVTGKEAQALIESGRVNVNGGGISGSVVPQSNGNAVIRLHSGVAIHEPVLNFVVQAGQQTRQYTAMLNPAHYRPAQHNSRATATAHEHAETGTTIKTRSNRAERTTKPVRRPVVKKATTSTMPVIERTGNTYHEVQKGESLAQIAERYRPHNISMHRAMRALMAANPRAFRAGTRGNVMYDKATLYIPTEAQWQAYANQNVSSKRRPARIQRRNPVVADNASVIAQQASSAVAQQAPVTQATTISAANPSVSPSNTSAVVMPASVPTEKAAVVAASNVVETAKPAMVSGGASAPAASQVTNVQLASAASASVASETVVASAPVASPVAVAKPVAPVPAVVETPEEPETDWMQMGLMGLVGVAALGGVGYLATRRRKSGETSDDNDDMFLNEKTPSVSAAQALQRSWDSDDAYLSSSAKAETFDLNDEDDGFFVEESTITPQNKPNTTFNLNDFEPENIQTAVVASSSVEEVEEEWDWLAETDSEATVEHQQDVYQNNDAFAQITTAVTGVAAAADGLGNENQFIAQSEAVQEEVSSDESWLNDVLVNEEAVQVAPTQPQVFDDELVFDNFAVPAVEMLPETDVMTNETESFDLNLDTTDVFVEHVPFEAETENQALLVADEINLDFSDSARIETVSLTNDTDALSFVTPEIAMEEETLALPQTALADDKISLNFDVADIVVETPQSFELPETAVEEPITLEIDDVDFNVNLADEVSIDNGLVFVDETEIVEVDANEAWLGDLNAIEEPQAELVVADTGLNSNNLDLTEPVFEASNTLDTLSVAESPVESNVTTTSQVEELLSWDSDANLLSSTNSAGFVSEAVGMEAPHEAKLELAKMYLEIDDAVAARETLRELIGESSGDLQAQAQQLLEELGG
ncbi:MAG: FimV/HubP family polar landmark protein [Alysiella sp.]|uniref:FimV/HubP family polar landmark protein n=1 Tax=Alysiella sp. TaxID=1872483 RepID=UPI0026DD80D1|nr:FimV/HubP family polar landmark protein [Alysiella sp.]MDO4433082.1 FimV/HubP family polar landmark protein [Alysiella sp.]